MIILKKQLTENGRETFKTLFEVIDMYKKKYDLIIDGLNMARGYMMGKEEDRYFEEYDDFDILYNEISNIYEELIQELMFVEFYNDSTLCVEIDVEDGKKYIIKALKDLISNTKESARKIREITGKTYYFIFEDMIHVELCAERALRIIKL